MAMADAFHKNEDKSLRTEAKQDISKLNSLTVYKAVMPVINETESQK